MARVLGKPGRYVEDQTLKKAQRVVLVLLIAGFICATLAGFLLGRSVSFIRVSPFVSLPFLLLTLGLVHFGYRKLEKRIDAIERDKISFRKGAVGEALITGILENLSDDYVVINDLSTPFGNLDHVVVGPTGVFIVDTKNWKGIIDDDGTGELLLNGKPTSKPAVKNLVRTVMRCREQIETLCQAQRLESNLFIRAVLAFPTARVEARWGKAKNAVCVSDEGLVDYIETNKPTEKLTKNDIGLISRAFEMLARMDEGFPEVATTQTAAHTEKQE